MAMNDAPARLGSAVDQRLSGLGLDDDRGDGVGDHVMQLPRDPGPFLADGEQLHVDLCPLELPGLVPHLGDELALPSRARPAIQWPSKQRDEREVGAVADVAERHRHADDHQADEAE